MSEGKREFISENQFREFNRMSDDSCYISQKVAGNQKRLKYMTTNVSQDAQFVTEGKVNFLGVPAQMSAAEFSPQVDTDLKFAAATQCKGRDDPKTFPLNGPYFTSTGPTADLSGLPSRERGACNVKPTEFQDRIYTPFINIEVPDPMKSVYAFGPQNGVSTRQENRVKPSVPVVGTTGGVGSPVECTMIGKHRYDCK